MITVNNRKLCENCFKETSVEPCPHCGFLKTAHRQDPITLTIGSILNQRYMIGRVIGKGGFGITYLAYDLKLDTRLAVKEYYPMGMAIRMPGSTQVSVSNEQSEESFRTGAEKFYNEAKMVAKFNGNPNIVSVHDFFYENDTVYFTMGYLEGQTLKSYINDKNLTEGQAVKVLQDISNALMASHSMNILHRDISPDNIMLCDDGSIKLLDFGAARQVMAEQSQSLSVILKQGFAPLEQYQKKGRQGPWTDIYALGATIYHALTGSTLDDPMTRLENDSVFEENRHGISDELWNIIHKALMLKIEDRYQDVFELKKDLNALTIKPEAIYDVKEESYGFQEGHIARAFGSEENDPNATMLLSGAGQTGMAGNETVALPPDGSTGNTGQPQQFPQDQQMQAQQPVPPQPVQQGQGIPPVQQPVGQQPMGQQSPTGQGWTPQNGPAGRNVPPVSAKKQGSGILFIVGPIVAAVLALIFLVVGISRVAAYKDDNKTVTYSSGSCGGGGGFQYFGSDIEEPDTTYESDNYMFSIGYNSEFYTAGTGDTNPVEFINDDGTHHMAVIYIDTDPDGGIIYDKQDYMDLIDVNYDLLLPSDQYSDLELTDTVEDTNSEGENYFTYYYSCTDSNGRIWDASLTLFDGEGAYGCYGVYQMVADSADNVEELFDTGNTYLDTFKVTGEYDPDEFTQYYSEDYGIRFSTRSESEAEIRDDGSIFVTFDPDGAERVVGLFPGELYGDTYEEMFEGIADEYYTDLVLADKMYPMIHGRYSGYMVSTKFPDRNGVETYGLIMALTTDSSDSQYKTYLIVADDTSEDLDYMTELVDGFRFDGAPAVDLSGVDGEEGVPLSGN